MPSISKCVGRISVLLDYYPSAQFAGLHVANRMGFFKKLGLELDLIPPPGAGGDEPQLVCNLQRAYDKNDGGCMANVPRIVIGTVEQNVLIPAVAPGVPSKAFATIFQSSPLALGALPGTKLSSAADMNGKKIGMHVDSVELMSSLMSLSGVSARIMEVQRERKIQDLLEGKVDAIQIYDCMEAIELRNLMQQQPNILRLTDFTSCAPSGRTIPLGYSQVLFGAKWALRAPQARSALSAFLEASAEGWKLAKSEPAAAAAMVVEDRGELKSVTGSEVDSVKFQEEALQRCLPYVFSGPSKVGAIDPQTWQEASYAMGITGYSPDLVSECNSLDSTLWPATSQQANDASRKHALVTDGLAVADAMRADAKVRAEAFAMRVGRKPCLAIVTIGTGNPHGAVRKSLFADDSRSWFNKSSLCESAGIQPLAICLPESASFACVHDAIMGLNRRDDVDAIVLERPVPSTLDADLLGSYISADKDVDDERHSLGAEDGGANMAAQGIFQASPDLQLDLSLRGKDEVLGHPAKPPWLCKPAAVLPCTVAGVLHLLHRSALISTVKSGLTVVIGRSPQLGAPLARELAKVNATVAVCHTQTEPAQLRKLCAMADTLVVAAGSPGLVTKDMVKRGALVINCGTTFSPALNKLLPDVHDEVAEIARFLTPTPHGVGPTCAAALTLNTLTLAEAAARRRHLESHHKVSPPCADLVKELRDVAEIPEGWTQGTCARTGSPLIRRTFSHAGFRQAAEFIADMTVLSERANHHPTFSVNPARTCETEGGCDVDVELSSYSEKVVTYADVALARRLNALGVQAQA